MSAEEIISTVQKYTSLWNMKHPQYHNKLVADRLWEKVADELKLPKDAVKNKWRNTRDRFNKEYKKIPNPHSGASEDSAPIYKGKWPHFQAMLFEDVVKPLMTVSSLDSNEESNGYFFAEEDPDNTVFEGLSESILCDMQTTDTPATLSTSSSKTPPIFVQPETVRPSEKKLKKSGDSASNFELEMLKNELEKLDLLREPEDDDMNFLKSLIPYLKTMNPVKKLKLRGKILSLVVYELDNNCASYTGMSQHVSAYPRATSSPRNNDDCNYDEYSLTKL